MDAEQGKSGLSKDATTTRRYPTFDFGIFDKPFTPGGKTRGYVARFSVYDLDDDGGIVSAEIHVCGQDVAEHEARNEALAELSRRVSHLGDQIALQME